ncbi:hypothetical protein [Antarctobacter jejuensis]|uniref:hypothetical protein n=1 Tax=Antarctobacter jejuensis TaxID=1439938 RepID=UPI003FD5C136
MRMALKSGGLALCLGLFLAGCGGDPLSEVPRYSDVPLAEGAGQADALTPETPRTPATDDRPRRGLLGILGARADRVTGGDGAETASASRFRRGGGEPKPGAPDYREVPLGTQLPYGEIARVCSFSKRDLGTQVEGYPERRSQYVLYDAQPGATSAHSFYLTGFKDGCARTFSAALVIFGSPESYEQIHYGPSGETQPLSETDKAYETVKRRVCGARQGRPCGSKMNQLARDTVFVSVYERFGSNPRWKNILLHDGEVAAVDLKD